MPVWLPESDLTPERRAPDLSVRIVQDRACLSCGYNLVGLMTGGCCPECGELITRVAPKPSPDELIFAPQRFIRLMQFGGWLLLISALGAVGVFVANRTGWSAGHDVWLAIAITWFTGVGALSAPRPAPPHGQRRKRSHHWGVLRALSLATQLAWPIAAVLAWISPSTQAAIMALLIVGWIGLAPLSWFMALHADWAGDGDLGARLRILGVWLVLFGALVFGGVSFRIPVGIFGAWGMVRGLDVFLIALILAIAFWLWRLKAFVHALSWASSNAVHQRRRREAMQERLRQDREESQAALDRSRPFGGPLPPY